MSEIAFYAKEPHPIRFPHLPVRVHRAASFRSPGVGRHTPSQHVTADAARLEVSAPPGHRVQGQEIGGAVQSLVAVRRGLAQQGAAREVEIGGLFGEVG